MIFQASGNFAQTVTADVAVKDPADDGCLIVIDNQFAIRTGIVSKAPALGHLGGSILETFA